MPEDENTPLSGDETRKGIHDISEMIGRVEAALKARPDDGAARETQEKLTDALRDLAGRMAAPGSRRSQPDLADADDRGDGPAEGSPAYVDQLIQSKAETDEVRRLHQVNDNLLLARHILRDQDNRTMDVRRLKMFQRAQRELRVLKSVSTGASSLGSSGSDWIPTVWSASLHELVRLQLRVASLHTTIDMPQDPFKLPIEGADILGYVVNEQGDSDANLDTTKMVTPAFSGSNQPGGSVLTLTTKKIGARVTFSAEAEEESIIPVFDYMRNKIVYAIARSLEDATINGDTAGTHQDGDVTSTADPRKAWKGYRAHAISGTKIANSLSNKKQVALQDLRDLRMNMGKYGYDTSKVVFVTGIVGMMKLLAVVDPMSATNPSPVLTVDKYGPQATILTGEIGKIDGVPIIVSPFVREDLNTAGVQDGVTTDRTMIACVNTESFLYGNRRAIRVESERLIVTDQVQLVTMLRRTFANWWAGQGVVGYVYNIQK